MSPQSSNLASVDDQTQSVGAATRPPSNEDVIALMDAEVQELEIEGTSSINDDTVENRLDERGWLERQSEDRKILSSSTDTSIQALTLGGAGLAALGSSYLLIFQSLPPLGSASAFAGFCISTFLAQAVLKRRSRSPISRWSLNEVDSGDGSLAGTTLLASLGISHQIIDADPDPRLITTPDGAVVYANAAYKNLATVMGIGGSSALPPRFDRIFAAEGSDAKKLFSLARAAKGMQSAREEIFLKGAALSAWPTDGANANSRLSDGVSVRQRFEVSLTPHAAPRSRSENLVGWRIRELPIDDDDAAALSLPYSHLPIAVFALDRSGEIIWANDVFYRNTGLDHLSLLTLDDLILGDTASIADALWLADGKEQSAKIRPVRTAGSSKNAGSVDVQFKAFRRAGAGQGFVYVTLDMEEPEAPLGPAKIGGELSESPFGVAILEGEVGKDAKIVEANQAFLEPFDGANKGSQLDTVFDQDIISDISAELKSKPGTAPRSIEAIVPQKRDGQNSAVKLVHQTGSASDRTFALYVKGLRRKRGAYGKRRAFLYTIEITEQKRMQEGHVQDQKLKAIGNIAGEVAHDFNNILQVVLHTCEDLLMSHPAGDPAYQDLLLIRENAQRAANLTAQLLAYSRKQTLTKKTQSITDLLVDFSRFLDRAVGEKVRIDLRNGRSLPPVRVDRTQLETALMNLAVNARDAMAPDGGRISIETMLVSAANIPDVLQAQLRDSDHVLIQVSDSGPGVPQAIIDKIFDPFFTTKDPGKGTGLGLSAVQGVIGQMGGAITVENASKARQSDSENFDRLDGAIFRIYLPADEASQCDPQDGLSRPVSAPIAATDCSGAGRILVVEDEPGVRLVVVKTLEKAGYDVAIADDGVDALEILNEDADFDLVISDIMMPEIDGPTMIAEARDRYGLQAEVIFMSGYAEAAVRDQLAMIDNAQFIQKPFQKADLGVMVRAAIYGPEAD
ncbi:MAG: response regulator [Pseudomonadota bacterium]